jgi:excisionase family DNA binding protein
LEVDETVWMNTEEAAAYLGVEVTTLYAYRHRGPRGIGRKGPRSYKSGKRLRYRKQDLDRWLELEMRPGEADG